MIQILLKKLLSLDQNKNKSILSDCVKENNTKSN